MSIADLIALIAEATDTDRRSVEREMLGMPVRGRAGVRIRAEMQRRGVRPYVALAATIGTPTNEGSNAAAG